MLSNTFGLGSLNAPPPPINPAAAAAMRSERPTGFAMSSDSVEALWCARRSSEPHSGIVGSYRLSNPLSPLITVGASSGGGPVRAEGTWFELGKALGKANSLNSPIQMFDVDHILPIGILNQADMQCVTAAENLDWL